MKSSSGLLLAALLAVASLAACSGDTVDVGGEENNAASNNGGDNNAASNNAPANNGGDNNTPANNGGDNNVPTNNTPTNNGGDNNSPTNNGGDQCSDTTLYADSDMDGYGSESTTTECLADGESPPSGFAREGGDCADDDSFVNPGSDDVCGDNLDENCTPGDDACPTTNETNLDVPDWDCVNGPAPANVIAWAHFADGGQYFQPNGCFLVYEGLPGEFYSKKHLERSNTSGDCDSVNGCTCPSLNGWPSYDRRLYAFLLQGSPEGCAEISLRDHAGEEQVVSNECRKYFYQLHWPGHEIPYSYVANGEETVRQRLESFPTLEIACAEDAPHSNLPFSSLMTAQIQFNDGFVKKQ